MKFLFALLLTALLAYLTHVFSDVLPWWTVVFAGFVAGATIPQRGLAAFVAGFWGVALLWILVAYFLSDANNGLLTTQMAQVLPLSGNTTLLYVLAGFLGGLVGGFGALTGHFLRKPLPKPQQIVA